MQVCAFMLVLSICCSCTIKGSFRGLYSYYGKTKSSHPELLLKPAPDSSICEMKNEGNPRVYVINGNSLKKCLEKTGSAIVYIWSPGCKSELCYSLNLVQQECDKKGVDLYIVSEYYEYGQMSLRYRIRRPILGIDTEYYKTNLTSKYLSRFLRNLGSSARFEKRFFYFENGRMTRSFSAIEEI